MASFLNTTGAMPRLNQQDLLDVAGGFVDKHLQEDRQYLELSELLKVVSHSQPSNSGLSDYDYPNLTDINVGIDSLPELSSAKRIPLPPELLEQFSRVQCRCLMGLFPQIERAWLTIDSDVFIWRFEDGGDLAYFDGLAETILSVALVRPKPYIFEPRIQYLLCIATSVDIVLLGVTFGRPALGMDCEEVLRGEMHLLPEPLFSIPTDKFILSITSSDSGRIFMSAKDGYIYELLYQADDGWFSRKCRLTNHSTGVFSLIVPSFLTFSFSDDDPLVQISIDNSRDLLYTRSEKGTIQMYDMDEDGQGMCRVAIIRQQSIVQQAASIAKTIDRSNFKPLVHIAAVTKSESVNIHLVAITETGVRLYFSGQSYSNNEYRPSFLTLVHVRLPPGVRLYFSGQSYTNHKYRPSFLTLVHVCLPPGVRLYFSGQSYQNHKYRPSFLTLVHVRLPPGYSANLSTRKPTNIHMAYYRRGTVLMASSITEDSDVLWTMSPDTFPFQPQLMESQVTVPIDGHTWDICELPYPPFEYDRATISLTGEERSDPPLVVTQHVEMPRRFVILNSQGTYIITKMRPVDQLRQLLINNSGPHGEEVRAFFKLHKVNQACATCLILACSKLHSDQKVSEWAKLAFFMYGREAGYTYQPTPTQYTPTNIGALNQSTAYSQSPMVQPLLNQYNTPVYQPNITIGSPSVFQPAQASTPQTRLGVSQNVIGQQQNLTNQQHTFMQTPNTSIRQMLNQSQVNQTVAPYGMDLAYSGKHNGICTYLGRILRPFWDGHVVTEFPQNTPHGQIIHLTCTYRTDQLTYILELMQDLADFIQNNSAFESPLQAESVVGDITSTPRPMLRQDGFQLNDATRKKLSNEAEHMEKLSLQKVHLLVTRVCEVVGLLNVLQDHQFHVLAANLTQDQKNQLKAVTFKQLVVSGKEICGSLISSLILRYHDDNATTDMISTRLRETCPSLYSSDDAVCSKASELLKAVKICVGPVEKQNCLSEALKLYKEVVTSINLPVVCNQFASVQFYEGIVDLCATAAQKRDPHNLALHCYKMGDHLEDKITSHAYFTRMECYECILKTLTFLLTLTTTQNPTIPKVPGVPTSTTENVAPQLTNIEAEQFKEKMLQLSLKSDDELFHVAIYDWLIKQNLTERLLQIQCPYLETYLTTQVGSNADNTPLMDLLWKFYEKTHNFSAAARILARLAERHSKEVTLQERLEHLSRAIICQELYHVRSLSHAWKEVTLQERLEHLSRAIICVKSCTTSVRSAMHGEFLHELEEKMEVARLQMQVYEEINNMTPRNVVIQEALSRLDSDLLDITTLYEDFADQFHLYECKLAIVHCASLNDAGLIEDLWLNIINRVFHETDRNSVLQTRMSVVGAKIVNIGKLYSGAEQYFPLGFIVKQLEVRANEAKFEPSWVFKCLLKTDVKFSQLYEIYDRQFRSKDPHWQTTRLQTLTVIQQLLKSFVEAPSIVPTHERRQLSNICRDNISHYLIELQAMSSHDSLVQNLSVNFRQLLSRLTVVLV